LQRKEKYFLKESELKNISKYCDLDKVLKILKQQKLAKASQTLKNIPFYGPKTSKTCEEGYKGRIGIFEVLPITESIKELIVKKATSGQIQEQAKKEGMRPMLEDGFIKAAQGITSIEEILRVIIK